MSNQDVNYQSVLADLLHRRDRLNQAILAIEQIIGEVGSGKEPANNPAYVGHSQPTDIYRGMTIGDACVHFLKTKGKRQSTGNLVRALKNGGIRSESKNLFTTVYNTMAKRAERKDSDLVKLGSEWGLSEWSTQG